MVSMVIDYPQKTNNPLWTIPSISPPVIPHFDYEGYKVYAELIRKAAEYDRIMKEPNCHDPKKLDSLRILMAKMDELGEKFQKISQDIKQLFDEISN